MRHMKYRRLFPRPSFRYFAREAKATPGFSFFNWLHGYIYGRWIYLYISIGTKEHLLSKLGTPLLKLINIFNAFRGTDNAACSKILFEDTYHGKVISLEAAKQLVRVEKNITIDDLEKVIPYARARSIILKNPESIVVLDCPCRVARVTPCTPLDVCLIIGEPFASFVAEHHPARSRRIQREEALTILEQEHQRGHVHHAFFKEAMLNRFYAICNCCGCCCGAIQTLKNGVPMLASSGFVAEIDREKCVVCSTCIASCQFNALQIKGKRLFLDQEKCLGCGVCASKCKKGAISLITDSSKGEPFDIDTILGEQEISRKD